VTPATSMWIWAIYLFGLGAILVLWPNALLVPFGFDPAEEVWIRVVGVLVLILAYYSLRAAQTDDRTYMEWTVTARALVPVFFIVFVLLGLAQPMLITFGFVDLAGAILTRRALRTARAA
jgi:uncharacterized membrane protein